MSGDTYVTWGSNALHVTAKGQRTKCGRAYGQFDYLPVNEEERIAGQYALCHKCEGTPRNAPRTIKEAFASKPYEKGK